MIRVRLPLRVRLAPVALAFATALSLAMGTAAQSTERRAGVSDPVLVWNDQVNRAIQVTSTDPFQASRALALESIAVLDTIRSINGGPAFLVRLPCPSSLYPEVAVASAAHAMLSRLFPTRQTDLDGALDTSLDQHPKGAARDKAVACGAAVGKAVFAAREHDGWNAVGQIAEGTAAGQWRPTPPAQLAPLDPQWATLVPFVLTAPSQFRPQGPPGLGTAAFKDAVATVASLGAAGSTTRTASQTEIAHYWSDAIGTYAPAGHWNAIAATLLASQRLDLDAEAELYAKLNVAMVDAGIAVADAKYTYWYWRPITVIRTGGSGAAPVPNWTPLLETPNHPSYISGHSGFSGAAAVILTARFGTRPFSFSSASVPGVIRTFSNFQQAAEEAAYSRVLGGIHFAFDNVDGLATGRQIGEWTLSAFRQVAADRGPVIVMDPLADNSASAALTGFALDNRAPVTNVSVRANGREPFAVAVDERGRFAIPRQRLGRLGIHDFEITASNLAGRTARARVDMGGSDGGTVTVPVTVK